MSEGKKDFIKSAFSNFTWQSVNNGQEGFSIIPSGLVAKMPEGRLKRFLGNMRIHPSFNIYYDSFYDGDIRDFFGLKKKSNELEEMLEEENKGVIEDSINRYKEEKSC